MTIQTTTHELGQVLIDEARNGNVKGTFELTVDPLLPPGSPQPVTIDYEEKE